MDAIVSFILDVVIARIELKIGSIFTVVLSCVDVDGVLFMCTVQELKVWVMIYKLRITENER